MIFLYVNRNYTLERMFTNQLLESAQDELSFRTVVRDFNTKSTILQIVLINPSSWYCTGYCFGGDCSMEPVLKLDLHPIIKVLFSDCTSNSEFQSRLVFIALLCELHIFLVIELNSLFSVID